VYQTLFEPQGETCINSILQLAIFLSCFFSAIYHIIDASKYYNISAIFNCLDYIGINLIILATPFRLLYYDKSINKIKCLFFVSGIMLDILIFSYQYYYKKILNKYIRQLPHAINLLICMLIIAFNFTNYILLFLYFLSFYIFFTIDYTKPQNKYWSQHETFHLVLLFAYVYHLYYENQIIIFY
jgi:predicted membrane channel-forming protein YqfA (hemolysin III family)